MKLTEFPDGLDVREEEGSRTISRIWASWFWTPYLGVTEVVVVGVAERLPHLQLCLERAPSRCSWVPAAALVPLFMPPATHPDTMLVLATCNHKGGKYSQSIYGEHLSS